MKSKYLIKDQFDIDLLADLMAEGPLGFELRTRDGSSEGKMCRVLLDGVCDHIAESVWTWLPFRDGVYSEQEDVDDDTRLWADAHVSYLEHKEWSSVRASWAISESGVLEFAGYRDHEQVIHDVAVMASREIHLLSEGPNGFLQRRENNRDIDFFILHPNYK